MLEMLATREETETGINYKVDSDAWYVVRNTNGVTGFVGVGSDPIPMEDYEVKNIFKTIGYEEEKVIREVVRVDFEIGDLVEIIEGPLEGNQGKICEIDCEHGKIKVMLEIFGRMTSTETEVASVKKVL